MEKKNIIEQINNLLNALPEDCYVNIFGTDGDDYDATLMQLELDDDGSVVAIVQALGNK